MLGNEQRRVGLGPFGRHGDVRQRAGFIDQGEPFGTLLGNQSGSVAQAGGHGSSLVGEVGARLRIESLEVDHRIVEQAACKLVAQRRAPALVAVGDVLVDHGMQPLLERTRRFFRRPRRWTAHGSQHAGEHAALDVVESVGLLAAATHEGFFVTDHALQYSEVEERAAHRHQFAPFAVRFQRESEAALHERQLGGELQQPLAQQAQRDLRVGPFEDRAGERQQHIAPPIVARQPAT